MRPGPWRSVWRSLGALSTGLLLAVPALAAELVTLTPETWDEYAPQGKEVDCIYGDIAIRNDMLTAVIANPIAGRNANMTVRDVGGCVIDLTVRERQSDQLSAFYPGSRQFPLRYVGVSAEDATASDMQDPGRLRVDAERVTLRLAAETSSGGPEVQVEYSLEEGEPWILVETTFTNSTDQPLDVELADALRADRTFQKSADGQSSLFWAYDEWFGQAYGVVGGFFLETKGEGDRNTLLRYVADGGTSIKLAPGESRRLRRWLIAGANLLEVKYYADMLANRSRDVVSVQVKDPDGKPLTDAMLTVTVSGEKVPYGWGRTDQEGQLAFGLPAEDFQVVVTALGREPQTVKIDKDGESEYMVQLGHPGWVVAEIVDGVGMPVPAKTQFRGREGTADPYFGPDSGEEAVQNLRYTPNGRYRQALPPGKYDVIVSYGPEYDAVFTELEVVRGQEAPLRATLIRSVQTPGWISADFHSHSSPSGDNTASQLGRVLNLLCEHLEFAPCTEHNRISNYVRHLEKLGATRLMATASGIELTGNVLPVNHQNAFPLEEKPRTQDGGGPLTDLDPELQIGRLAMWDDGSEKLVQENHPDIGQVFFDKNEDGQPDKGYEKMAGFMDAIEVHPPQNIFEPPLVVYGGKEYNNTIFNWLQLLNQGYRLPGVVNTDAHYNFHGSGFLRNYLLCSTDDPAEIKTIDMVHAAEVGHVIMTNGPFLEVLLEAQQASDKPRGTAGDDVIAPEGRATLHVRVQCCNWLEIDRVQVFLNGKPAEGLNFTRDTTPEKFAGGVVRFHQEIPLALSGDTHVIVAAAGEKSTLGPVMGPTYGKHIPIAVSNPIYVDVEGDGFKANGDTLGAPLPVKGGRAAP